MAKDENEETKARTFRLPKDTNDHIADIGKLLNLNYTQVLIRAVDYLYENMEAVAAKDFQDRLSGLKKDADVKKP